MARPTKQGLDYFPLDTQFDDDVQMFIAEYGSDGLSVLIVVWQIIYGDKGYYMTYDRKFPLKIKQRIGVSADRVEEIIAGAIEWGIFDKDIFEKQQILTSAGIQKRYFTGARFKKQIEIIPEIILIDVSNVKNAVSHEGNKVNHVGNATNKIKLNKTKLNKIKEDNIRPQSDEYSAEKSAEESSDFNNYDLSKRIFSSKEKLITAVKIIDLWNVFAASKKYTKVKSLKSKETLQRNLLREIKNGLTFDDWVKFLYVFKTSKSVDYYRESFEQKLNWANFGWFFQKNKRGDINWREIFESREDEIPKNISLSEDVNKSLEELNPNLWRTDVEQ